jgi:hypothetical protein
MSETVTVDEAAIEHLLGQVRGVLAVRVVADAQGQIEEIHVVGTPERRPKAMVRDLESLLYVRGGVRLDHRKISLVQMAEAAIQPAPVRVLLNNVVWAVDGDRPSVMIRLSMNDRDVEGVCRGRGEGAEPPEVMVGYATIQALDQVTGPQAQFRLENLQRQPFGALEVCLAHLSLITDDGVETLLGISVVREGDLAAIARAILDAVNRRLQRLLGERSAAGR